MATSKKKDSSKEDISVDLKNTTDKELSTDNSLKDMDFEQAIDELEFILNKMDMGELPLNESMDNFERGIKLINHCEGILNSYERKITKIIADKDGKLKDVSIDE